MKNETLFLMKLLSVCFFIGGCFSSTFYKSATVEEGKGSSGLAVGFQQCNIQMKLFMMDLQ